MRFADRVSQPGDVFGCTQHQQENCASDSKQMPPINISAAARGSALLHNPLSNALRIQTQHCQFPRLTTKSNTAMDQPSPKTTLVSDSNTTPTTTTPISPTITSLTPLQTLQPLAKFKARSHETSLTEHLPLLSTHFPNQNSLSPTGPTIVLLGDSMFERLKTTGLAPPNQPTAPWPWPALLDDATLASLEIQRLEGVFNAGVGGDTVQNIAYRLVGDESRDLPGLFPALVGRGTVRLWVVQAGTNNLKVKKGLGEADVERLKVVVESLLRADPGCKVLWTGLFCRRDMAREVVEKANERLAEVVKGLKGEFGETRVGWLPATAEVKLEEHLDDHVHLNLEGYRLWVRNLFPAVVGMLRDGEAVAGI